MSEVIGYTVCPMAGCSSAAEFKQDKRKKLYINCPDCGRIPGSTNKAQELFRKIQEDGNVYTGLEDAQAAAGISDNPEIIQEVELEPESETIPEDSENSTRGAGLLGLAIFALLGGGSWLISQKNRRT